MNQWFVAAYEDKPSGVYLSGWPCVAVPLFRGAKGSKSKLEEQGVDTQGSAVTCGLLLKVSSTGCWWRCSVHWKWYIFPVGISF